MATGTRLGVVTRVTAAGVYIELSDVAAGFEFGPCVDTVGGLAVGDSIVAQALARDEDEFVVTGVVGGRDAPTPDPAELLDLTYPVGAFYISAVSTSPATLIGGTWTQITDRMLIAVGANPRWDTALETGGTETVKLTAAQSGVAAHSHNPGASNPAFVVDKGTTSGTGFKFTGTGTFDMSTAGSTANNTEAPAAEAHDNMPPYVAAYMWCRTA